MDRMGSPPLPLADHLNSTKRKRSPSNDPPNQPTPPAKHSKTHSHHLQINYLARQFSEILPLISAEHDPLPSLLSLIGDYEGVLHRHESMAGNLGARPLGPILIQRFERLFDGPPRVLKVNGKENTSVGWLDVVEFARNKPEQFKLEQTRDGVKVCQFYTKQCRVEISEEDFVLVRSGMPQKLIPPQPIGEDEEKELGTLEILEKALAGCVHLADQVAGRARQLNHKIKSRKNAIVSRREAEATTTEDTTRNPVLKGGDTGHSRNNSSNGDRASNSPTASGFVAVNRYPAPSDRPHHNGSSYEHPRSNGPITNGNTPLHSASAATRAELLSKFHTTSERSNAVSEGEHSHNTHRPNSVSRPSAPTKTNSRAYADSMEYAGVLLNTASPVPIPSTPSSLLPYVKPSPADRFDDSGPYKADMMARMEQMNRGDRVQPPCDRCRRLHMDCLKNLTACMGCTKKHAKCSWKDVEEQELRDHPFVLRVRTVDMAAAEVGSEGEGSRSGGSRSEGESARKERKREMTEVRDEELLGEESADEDVEMKDGQDVGHSLRVDRLKEASTTARSPPAASTSFTATNHENGDLGDLTTRDNAFMNNVTESQTMSSEPQASSCHAPQAHMRRSPTDEAKHTTEPNGHIQTEYEKDIYSQLHEATRASTDRERTFIAGKSPHEETTLRVYAAGSEPLPLEPFPPLVPPEEVGTTQGPLKESSSGQQQVEPEVRHTPPPPKEPSPTSLAALEERNHALKPQMPSPPLSGVPSRTTPTPVLEPQQPIAAAPQPMQT